MVRLRLAHAASRLNRAMVALGVAEGLAACWKKTRRGSRLQVLGDASSGGLWRYNKVRAKVIGLTVLGVVRNFDVASAPNLYASLMGTSPSCRELLLRSPSDARPWGSFDESSAARQMLPAEDAGSVSLRLCDQRGAVEREWDAGRRTTRFEFISGRPIPFYLGGVGGYRFLGMCPTPISHSMWRAATRPMINAQGVSMDMGDARCVGSVRWWPHVCCVGTVRWWRCALRRSRPQGSRNSARIRTDDQIPNAKMRARHARAVPVKSGIVKMRVQFVNVCLAPAHCGSVCHSVFLTALEPYGGGQSLGLLLPRLCFTISRECCGCLVRRTQCLIWAPVIRVNFSGPQEVAAASEYRVCRVLENWRGL